MTQQPQGRPGPPRPVPGPRGPVPPVGHGQGRPGAGAASAAPAQPRPAAPPPGGPGPAPSGAIPPAAPPAQAAPSAAPISPQPQRDVDPRRPVFQAFELPVATAEQVPGRQVVEVIGVVIGVATRPRDMAHNPEMAYINTTARQEAIAALVQQAREVNADAVVGLRFDGGKISETVTEIAAYGTAVKLSV